MGGEGGGAGRTTGGQVLGQPCAGHQPAPTFPKVLAVLLVLSSGYRAGRRQMLTQMLNAVAPIAPTCILKSRYTKITSRGTSPELAIDQLSSDCASSFVDLHKCDARSSLRPGATELRAPGSFPHGRFHQARHRECL